MKALFNSNSYLPIINGLVGDKLSQRQDDWAIGLSFRLDGNDVTVAELNSKLGSRSTVVFVHGLMADERIWKHFRGFDEEFSTLYVRYNTGLHIHENGKLLAELLKAYGRRFPASKIFLAGHSMGGLVIRSACHYAKKRRHDWVDRVAAIFLIAVPNAGAALEKVSHATAAILNRIARWHLGTIGNIIDQRSNGIKDLRLGTMLESDPLAKVDERSSVPPIPGIRYHILVGSFAADEKSLMARYFGDGLVTQGSAVGKTLFKVSEVKIFPKTGHNSILNDARVLRYVREVLKRGR